MTEIDVSVDLAREMADGRLNDVLYELVERADEQFPGVSFPEIVHAMTLAFEVITQDAAAGKTRRFYAKFGIEMCSLPGLRSLGHVPAIVPRLFSETSSNDHGAT